MAVARAPVLAMDTKVEDKHSEPISSARIDHGWMQSPHRTPPPTAPVSFVQAKPLPIPIRFQPKPKVAPWSGHQSNDSWRSPAQAASAQATNVMNWVVFILYKKMLNLVLNDTEVNVLNVYEMCMHVSQFSGSQLRCAEIKKCTGS
jgi:hypothetical protein